MKYDRVKLMVIANNYTLFGSDRSTSLKQAWKDIKKDTYRKAFNSVVREYAKFTNEYRETYNNLYAMYNEVYSTDIEKRAEESKCSKLDIVKADNHEKEMYEIALGYCA